MRRRADLEVVAKRVLIDVALWDEVHDLITTMQDGPAAEVFTRPRPPLSAEYLSGARGEG